MKAAGYILAAMASLAWGADEVSTYAEGHGRVGEDGWVLLCHAADWDSTHDEQWMRRQSSIRSSCGNALILYVPIHQNPTAEQSAELQRRLNGASVDLSTLRSVPCAILLDRDGRPYSTVSGNDFTEKATGLIRQAQTQLRTRNNLQRQAAEEEGPQKAQTLSRIYRLTIAPPPGLAEAIEAADPQDQAGIAEWTPFDPWALAERVRRMAWQEAMAELERVEQFPLSKEERQAVLAIRMGCVHDHLGVAGTPEIQRLAVTCTALAPETPLGKAAQRAAKIWSRPLELERGWTSGQLPSVAAECEISGVRELAKAGEFRIGFILTKGEDPLRVTCVTLYDGDIKVSEDSHLSIIKPGDPVEQGEYMLIVQRQPAHPRLVIAFDQQGKTDTQGRFSVRYFNEDGIEEHKEDITQTIANQAREQVSKRDFNAHDAQEKAQDASIDIPEDSDK